MARLRGAIFIASTSQVLRLHGRPSPQNMVLMECIQQTREILPLQVCIQVIAKARARGSSMSVAPLVFGSLGVKDSVQLVPQTLV